MNDLFSQHELPVPSDQNGVRSHASMGAVRLALTLDHRSWLTFLAEEWLCGQSDDATVRLGVNKGFDEPLLDGRIRVIAWIDPGRLPDIDVLVCRAGRWSMTALGSVTSDDEGVAWPAPVPLDAVASFSVASSSDRTRLIAMAQGFANIEMPNHSFDVGHVDRLTWAPPEQVPLTRLLPPSNWNALRGAAAMALWAVPPIDPWLDTLCGSLSVTGGRQDRIDANATWWHAPVWRHVRPEKPVPVLWTAMVEVLMTVQLREGWRPADVFSRIKVRALQLGADSASLVQLESDTLAILDDRKAITVEQAEREPLGLVLQIVLLRPTPERFEAWKDDLPGLPPAVWWTGAMLTGLLVGYRDLPLVYRGTPNAKRALALRTWFLSDKSGVERFQWSSSSCAEPHWQMTLDGVQIGAGEEMWAERTGSSRGRWYRANFDDAAVRTIAMEMARNWHPTALQRTLQVSDTRLEAFGRGTMSLDPTGRALLVNGQVGFHLDSAATLVDDLDVPALRTWLAGGSIAQRLPKLPLSRTVRSNESTVAVTESRLDVKSHPNDPPGLLTVLDFISVDEERKLLQHVECGRWLDELSRRVQHYGWKYEYKSKRVKRDAYIGPLPEWASELAHRLLAGGILREMPDQVIVNEYVGNQGIAKHIDCPTCFRGPVVTISLGESWGMVFRSPEGEKRERVLQQRSAVILDGPARSVWTHEIPKRQKEGSRPRGRRVSLTFRKVNVEPQLDRAKNQRARQ